MLFGVVQGKPLCKVRERCGWRSQLEPRRPQAVVCCEEHGSVLSLLREREELLTECLRRLILGTVDIMPKQAMQHGEKLMRIVQRVTELPRTDVGLSNLRSGIAFRGSQRYA